MTAKNPDNTTGMRSWVGVQDSRYYLVQTMPQFEEFYCGLKQQRLIAVDTETSGFDRVRDYACGISIGWGVQNNYYLTIAHKTDEAQLSIDEIRDPLNEVLCDPKVTKVFWNEKFDRHFLERLGIYLGGPRHDGVILVHLLDEARGKGLKEVALSLISPKADKWEKEVDAWRAGEAARRRSVFSNLLKSALADKRVELEAEFLKLNPTIQFSNLSKAQITQQLKAFVKTKLQDHEWSDVKKSDISYAEIPLEIIAPYAAADVHYTLLCYKPLILEVAPHDQLKKLYINEMMLSSCIYDVEEHGVKIDVDYLEKLEPKYRDEVEKLRAEICSEVGFEFNIDSPQQLVEALQKAGCALTKMTSKSDPSKPQFSADKEVLASLATEYEFANKILRYRELQKLLGTYVVALRGLVDSRQYLHSTFNANVSTGRMCLVRGTLIDTLKDGKTEKVLIENVKKDDLVLSHDELGRPCYSKVLWSGQTGVKPIWRCYWKMADGKRHGYLDGTGGHGIRVRNGKFKQLMNLHRGEKLFLYQEVVRVEPLYHSEPVYDLEVENTHAFVANEIAVHNSSSEPNCQNIVATCKDIRKAFTIPDDSDEYVFLFCDYCLAEDTKIYTTSGFVEIRDIKVGDWVYTYNHGTKKPGMSFVSSKKFTGALPTMVVVLSNGHRVRCTRQHKWLLSNEEEILAEQLQEGNELLSVISKKITVAVIEDDGLVVPTYDIEVERDHNFALAAGVFVHNSQIELRLTASHSQDPTFLDAYPFDGTPKDIHTITCAEVVMMRPIDEVVAILNDPKHPEYSDVKFYRGIAKRVNFGIIYGAGPSTIQQQVSTPKRPVTKEACAEYIKQYFARYQGVHAWIERTHLMMRKYGFLQNTFGRYRRLPKSMGRDRMEQQRAFRQGVNFLIQGDAADLFKHAVVRVRGLLKEHRAKTRMVNFVHDEIQFYLHKKELYLLSLIKKAMEDFPQFSVPIIVEMEMSHRDWGSKKPIKAK